MRLSIIIPVYNVEKYLTKCVASLLKLNSDTTEFIFINDGSTDNSLKVVEEISQQILNVVVINQENQGLSVARNNGLQVAKSDYVIFVDSDDTIDSEKLLKLLAFSELNNLDLLGYSLVFVNEEHIKTGEMDYFPLQYETIMSGKEALIQGYQPSSACLFIYNKNFLISNNLLFYPNLVQEDVEFTVRLLLFAKRVFFSKERVYNYLRRENSLSKSRNNEGLKKYLFDSIKVAIEIKKNIVNFGITEKELVVAIRKIITVLFGICYIDS